jgi:hypothetical protein
MDELSRIWFRTECRKSVVRIALALRGCQAQW